MDKRTEKNWKKQLDFAYAQVDYWKQMAFANKEELEYYKGIVEEAVAKDLQVKELAERVGVTLQHMSAVENGRKTASLKLLRKIAKELDCSLYEFIEE